MKPTTIIEYINAAPKESKEKLQELYNFLRELVPDAEESLKWGQPAFSHKWILFIFAGFKNYVSLYPTPSVIQALEKGFSGYKISSSTVQFPLDKPLPFDLIRKIIKYRL